MINLGLNSYKLRIGDTKIVQGYLGNTLVYDDSEAPAMPYTELPYLWFTGKSYVDTGIIPDIDTRVEMKLFRIDEADAYFPFFGGSDNDNEGNWFRFRTETGPIPQNGAVGDKRNDTWQGAPISTNVSLDKDYLSYQYLGTGSNAPIGATYMNEGHSSIYIHSENRLGVPTDTKAIDMRCGAFKIFKNDVLVADLRPCTDGDTYFFYDIVSNEKRENIGEGELVFEHRVNIHTPFTIEALEDGKLNWDLSNMAIIYSINGGPTEFVGGTIEIDVKKGQIIEFKVPGSGDPDVYPNYKNRTIQTNFKFNVFGNIMSIVEGNSAFEDNIVIPNIEQFKGFFKESKVVSAKELILPTTLTGYCFMEMFKDCKLLTKAPELKSTKVSAECFREMFSGCSSLIEPPTSLTAGTLSVGCFYEMFKDCTSITSSPKITTTYFQFVSDNVCNGMFSGCEKLEYIYMTGQRVKETGMYNITLGVAPTGTFVKSRGVDWPIGPNGIPEGWVVQEV